MKHMAAHGVKKAVIGVSHAPNENEMIQAAVRKYPETFVGLCGWGIQKPLTGQQAAEVCDRWLQEPEFIGVGEVLFYSLNVAKGWDTTVQDWWKEIRPVMDVVTARKGVILFHTGFSGAHSGKSATPLYWKDPLFLDQIAREYWQTPMIIGHSGGQYAPFDQHALVVAYNHDNCYLETSKSRTDVIETAVKEIGSSRILFGSDWTSGEPMPLGPISERPAHLYDWNIANVTRAKISDEDKENILYKNATSLFTRAGAASA
jgi:predicted TIM-barrel fold metal-dependent hydrolase